MARPHAEILDEARDLQSAGRFACAARLLEGVDVPPDAPLQARDLHVETQRLYRAWAEAETCPDDPLRTKLFFRGQEAFYRAIYIDPGHRPAYLEHAAFWQCLGDPAMARRLLRSLRHIAAHPALDEALAQLPDVQPGPPPRDVAPLPHALPPELRVLVVVIPGYDPGMDVLYDGLCSVLGADNVEEYPWKPMLHGEAAEQADEYPTTCNHPGTPRGLTWVCEALRARHFYAVLYADMIQSLPREDVRAIVDAAQAGDTPLYIVDGWDDAADNQALLLEHLGVAGVPAYFKREMLRCHNYGPNVFPLPLAYADSRVPAEVQPTRTQMLFWAGNRYYGLRRLYLSYLEAALGIPLDTKYTQAAYVHALQSALIAPSFCGFGFDTVRYWEAPAHGAMLFAEHPPIRIPHDYRDGETAVFFEDLPELEEKLVWYSQRPEEAARIALAGHAHFRRYHTASARARQLLGYVGQVRS